MPVLNYDKSRRVFWYTYDKDIPSMSGLRIELAGGRRYVFDDASPRNYNNIKAFKTMFGFDAKASADAKERIDEIVSLQHKNFVADYSCLLSGTPFEHQKAAIEAMQKSDRLALLLEQGLGKTYISLMSLRMFKERDGYLRALVMCPAIVVESWLAETAKFSTGLKVIVYKGNLQQRMTVQQRIVDGEEYDIILTTYDMVRDPSNKSKQMYYGFAWNRLASFVRERIASVFEPKQQKILLKTKQPKNWQAQCGKILSELENMSDLPAEVTDFMKEVQRVTKKDVTVDFLNTLDLSVAVFDEASRLINAQAYSAKEVAALKARRMYLLSGTLCVGRPTDMFMPMTILDQGIFQMNWWQFTHRYCCLSSYNKHIITGYKNIDDLKRKIAPYIIQYKREDCLDLPDRTVVTCYYDVDASTVELYNSILLSDDYVTVKDKPVYCSLEVQKIQKCLQVLSGFIHVNPGMELCAQCSDQQMLECEYARISPSHNKCKHHAEFSGGEYDMDIILPSNPKLDMLEADLLNITPTEKVIVWAWYKYDLAAITKLLTKLKIKYITANEKQCAQRFEADGTIRVFLGQTAQGIGITLNSATTTIYYSHGTALEPRLQSMDRNMRIGQSKPIVIRDYVCKGSVEESLVYLLQHKDDVHNFIQQQIECLTCKQMQYCDANKIRKYGVGCMYYNNMKAAESKVRLQLSALKEY